MSIAKVWNSPNLLDSQVKREIRLLVTCMSHDPAAAAQSIKDTLVAFQKLAKYLELDW